IGCSYRTSSGLASADLRFRRKKRCGGCENFFCERACEVLLREGTGMDQANRARRNRWLELTNGLRSVRSFARDGQPRKQRHSVTAIDEALERLEVATLEPDAAGWFGIVLLRTQQLEHMVAETMP